MPTGVTGHDGKIVRQNVDNFAFAFVAPLGAHDHCCVTALHWKCTLLARSGFSQFKKSLQQMSLGNPDGKDSVTYRF
jgi:hypothetical protein